MSALQQHKLFVFYLKWEGAMDRLSLMLMRYCQVWLVEPKLAVDNRPSTKVHIFYVYANILFAENPVTHAAVVAKVATFKLMGQKQRQSSGGFTATLTDYTLIVRLPFI